MTSMKKLFLSLLIIVNIFQSSYAMDRELIVREGMRAGLSIGGAALAGLGVAKFHSKVVPFVWDEYGKRKHHFLFSAGASAGIIGVLWRTNYNPLPYNNFLCGFMGSYFAFKAYQIYLNTFPNKVDSERCNALMAVVKAKESSVDTIKSFIENGADPNKKDDEGKTSLIYAIQQKAPLEIVQSLLAKGADPNKEDKRSGYWTKTSKTPLMHAICERAPLEIVRCLLENGADPNKQNMLNKTALIYAICERAPLEIVQCLLKKGADPNKRDKQDEYWKSPLMYAIKEKASLEIVRCLLENGAEINAKDGSSKKTPLMYAVDQEDPDLDVMKMLFEYGANPNEISEKMRTALTLAVSQEKSNGTNLDAINLLLEMNADVNMADKRRNRSHLSRSLPLFCAVDKKNPDLEVIRTLLRHNADPNVQDQYQTTPLLCCTDELFGNNLGVIKTLLEANPNLSVPSVYAPNEGSVINIFLKEDGDPEVRKIIIAHIFKLARQNDFSVFDIKDLGNKIVFYIADEHDKTVFDYAIEHKNRKAIAHILGFINEDTEEFRSQQRVRVHSLKHRCSISFGKGVEYTDRQAIMKIFDVEGLSHVWSLKHHCLSFLNKNVDTIDLENSKQVAKLKDVFHILTARYRVENLETEH
jgi:ankyrin repeat protein